MARIWADAESAMDDEPGKVWCVATVRAGGRRVAAAWAAAYETEEHGQRVLKCCDNYEHPDWRGRGLYGLAYAWRHATVLVPSGLPAVTYVFAQPVAKDEADGWVVTDEGDSADGHHWYEMRRDPPTA